MYDYEFKEGGLSQRISAKETEYVGSNSWSSSSFSITATCWKILDWNHLPVKPLQS